MEKNETNIVCSIHLFSATCDFLDNSIYNKNLLLICYSIGAHILSVFTFESDIQFITLYTELIIVNQLVDQNKEHLNFPENWVSDFLPIFVDVCQNASEMKHTERRT